MDNLKTEPLKIVHEELESLYERIINNHRNAGQVASGKTIKSLKVEQTNEGGILWGRKAFGTLETGRNAGKVPKGFYYIIQQWVADKGIQVENPKTFSYFVARKIAREGTQLHRKGGRSDIYSKEIKKTIEYIMKRITGLFASEVEHININSNENT